MMMTNLSADMKKAIDLVQESWMKAMPFSSEVSTLFYQNLFALDPGLRAFFKGDMRDQGDRFVQMLDFAVKRLTELEVLEPVLHKLGQTHLLHGVTASHYDLVGTALLQTLEQTLARAFTADIRVAWTTIYGVIARTMIAGAEMPGQSPASTTHPSM
jgi:methyl-accepting chemotaxis protein